MGFIEVLALGYTLPGKRLLFSDVEFKVASGQRVALIGGNGVGKSTVLRVIAGEDNVKEVAAAVTALAPTTVPVQIDETGLTCTPD